ncbi:MAG: YtxH domain-containing protein [Anaerolineales bacterium]|nr:YtxH domain-containing protein [Anaerolineales bacterium]
MSERDEFGAFLVGFIVGGLTGAVVALLFAPQSGEETRALIKDKSIELRDKAQVTAEEALARAEELAADARHRAEELAKEARARATELANEVRERGKNAVEVVRERGKSAVEAVRKPKKGDGEVTAS